MVRKNTFVMVAAVAILLLQFSDCLSAMTMDQQSMQCCGSIPCDPSNQSHDCCKSMASSQSPSVLPVGHVPLPPPVLDFACIFPPPHILRLSQTPPPKFPPLPTSRSP